MNKFTCTDSDYMTLALEEAKQGFANNEVPVGAVLLLGETILARAHNAMESRQDATCHAEILCLQAGARLLNSWRLDKTTLYVTVEPCPMCLGAARLSRVHRIVWGCPNKRYGACSGRVDSSFHSMHPIEMTTGILDREAAELMRTFFQKLRREKQHETS